MSLYLGDQLISGVNTPVQGRVIGQIIQSTIPLADAGLHLADGSIITSTGIYKDFYNYMMAGYENGIRISGSLTNNNGVFSGFNNDSYLYIPGVRTNDNTEFVIKFTTGSDITTSQCIIGCEHFLALDFGNTDGKLSSWNWETSAAVDFSYSISANQTYYVKIVCNGNTRTFSISTNGSSYTELSSFTDNTITNNIDELYQFVLGRYSHQASNPFLGSIDVKGCYIKLNNELLWDGSQYSVLPGRYIDETRYQEYMTDYGVCGKYAISYKDKTIRLPYITGIIEGTLNSSHIGNVTAAGLPNITGNIVVRSGYNTASANGAFYVSNSMNDADQETGSTRWRGTYTLNASRSSSIYGNSNTVQPQTVKVYIYIVIATLTKTEVEVDIDEIATDLNGKADKDLANINYGSMKNALNSDDIPYIIATYRNGFSWHNIYSDGWVEQGGRYFSNSGSAGYKDINLLVEMADTNFCIYTTRGAESTTTNYNVWAQNPGYTNSTTMIRVYVSNVSAYVYWRVTGRSKTS